MRAQASTLPGQWNDDFQASSLGKRTMGRSARQRQKAYRRGSARWARYDRGSRPGAPTARPFPQVRVAADRSPGYPSAMITSDSMADTSGASDDSGRSYAVPYERVWRTAVEVARSSRGWSVLAIDPVRGRIEAEARTAVWKFVDLITIELRLDELGSTRLHVTSAAVTERPHLGVRNRRIRRFLRSLDAALQKRS